MSTPGTADTPLDDLLGVDLALNDEVEIGPSAVKGKIIGITHYAEDTGYQTNYFVRYLHPQTFLPVEDWFSKSLLHSAAT